MKKLLAVTMTLLMIVGFTANVSADPTATATVQDVGAASNIGEAGTIRDSFNGGEGKRGLYIMNQATFIPPASYFGPNEEGHQFMPLKTLLHFQNEWPVAQALEMLSEKKDGKDVEIRPMIRPAKDAVLPTTITCVLEDPAVFDVVGFGAIAANENDAITPDVFAQAIVEAQKLNANVIQFLAEGKNVKLLADGWGINLNGGVSVITGDNSDDNAVGGGGFAGTGFSSYESGYSNMPWLQMVFLRVPVEEEKKTEVIEEEVVHLKQNIMFDHDSADLRADQKANLDKISAFAAENPDFDLVIKGYASQEGNKDYNMGLSIKRAEAVKGALIDRGVDSSSIRSVTGQGATTMFGDILKTNRRVLVISVDE